MLWLPADARAAESSIQPPGSGFDPLVARYYEDASSGVLLSSFSSILESNNPTPYELRTPEGILVPLRGQRDTSFDNLRLVTRRGEDFLKVERTSSGSLNFEWGVGQFRNSSADVCVPGLQIDQLGTERSTEWVGQPVLTDMGGQREAGPSMLTSSTVTFRVTSHAGTHHLLGARIDWQGIVVDPIYQEPPGRNTCETYSLGSNALLNRACEDCETREKCSMETLKLSGPTARNRGSLPAEVVDITSRPIERRLGEHWIGAVLKGKDVAPSSDEPDDAITQLEPGLVRIRIGPAGTTVDVFHIGGETGSRIISLTRDVFGRLLFILDREDSGTRIGRWQPDVDRSAGIRWLGGSASPSQAGITGLGAWDGQGRPRMLLTDPGGTTWMYVQDHGRGAFVPILIGDSSSYSLYVPRFFPDGSASRHVLHDLESLGFSDRPISIAVGERSGRILLTQDRHTYECAGGFCLEAGGSSQAAGGSSQAAGGSSQAAGGSSQAAGGSNEAAPRPLLEYSNAALSDTSPIGPFTVARDTRILERGEASSRPDALSITCEKMQRSLSGRPTATVACTPPIGWPTKGSSHSVSRESRWC